MKHASPLSLEESRRLLERARALVPGTTHSMMKRPEQFAPGAFPVFLRSGKGAEVEDVDGNRYVDFVCGLGANALGHRHPSIEAAIISALERGVLHSLPTELELTAGEALVRCIPGAEMARFFKTGADATSAAVRLSRSITGRDRIITVGYNGWHDHFVFDTPGVPASHAALTSRHLLMDPGQEEQVLQAVKSGEYATVLLTVPYNRQLSQEFLKQLRTECTESETLLTFDEIVTGFRLALGGAQEFFGVSADIVCLSKALAAGMPLSAVVGPQRILSKMEELQVSTTFGGECLSLAACTAALEIYQDKSYFEHIASLGRQLREGVNHVAEEAGSSLRIVGYDPIPMWLFHRDPSQHVPLMQEFVGRMAACGVLMRRDVNFICAAHTSEHIRHTIESAKHCLAEMRRITAG